MKEQAQTIADIFWETKISSNQKSCGISNESKLFEVLRDTKISSNQKSCGISNESKLFEVLRDL
jgi:hypothetical protein